jgi:hypothetical protein
MGAALRLLVTLSGNQGNADIFVDRHSDELVQNGV